MAQNTIKGSEGIKSIPTLDDLIGIVTDLESKMKDGIQRSVNLEKEIRARTEERDGFKVFSQKLEKENDELKTKVKLNGSESQEFNIMKEKSEEILTRAKSIIFEKTKVCKNQELQIEALTQQVVSLKEVVSITKDLLEIRNMEVNHLHDQINIMSQKIDAEKERQDIVHEKLDKMISLNSDLKIEYQTQLCLFNALRQRYNENELAKGIVKPPVEPNIPEIKREEQEARPEQNGVVEPNISQQKTVVQHGDTETSTAETSDVESVGLSTIDENSSAEQS